MFDPLNRRMISKKHAWPSIRRGALMRLYLDTETYGFDQHDVPYSTPAYPGISEYGDCLMDVSFNYLNSAQIFPRRPPWLLAQPAALVLQRLKNGPEDLDDPKRPNYWRAMANIAWRIEQAASAYDKFGDEPITVPVIDYNTQFKDGKKKALESVISVPLLDDDGKVCHDVRWHPERRRLSYRFDRDSKSPYYWGGDNQYYKDENDGSEWRWVQPSLNVYIYNRRYDLPILLSNLYRVGFDPQDTTFLYSRAAPSSRQNPPNYLMDVRDEIYSAALYGPQGEDGIKLGKVINPVTGKVRTTEALSAFLETNTRPHNVMRFIQGGVFMPHDGSKHDKAMDHGAAYDALGTAAASALAWERAPDAASMAVAQSREKDRRDYLSAQSPTGEYMPVFSLPRRQGGHDHSEQPYWYMGNDDQAGGFKTEIFLLANGTLHKQRFKGKLPHEMSTDDWRLYLTDSAIRSNPDRIVRLEKIRYMPPPVAIDTVLKETGQAARYRTALPDIKTDCKYILEHPDMGERILHALADINHARRFDNPIPQIPLLEDERPAQYARGVAYQEEAGELERRRAQMDGPRAGPLLVETIKNGMDNTYNFMRAIDRATGQLCLRAHKIDDYSGIDPLGDVPRDREAVEALASFSELCEAAYKEVYRKKNCPYTAVLDGIMKPNGEPFFERGKFKADNVAEAVYFRTELGLRALKDYERQLKLKNSPYIDGYVDKDFCRQKVDGRRQFLFADPDNGEKGATPHVVDAHGRELTLPYLQSVPKKDVFHQLIDTQNWDYRFYRLRSEPSILRLAHRFVVLGQENLIPPGVHELYEADKQRRIFGFPNETVTTARAPNLETALLEVKRLEGAATSRLSASQERDPNPRLSEAFGVLKYDESVRILAATKAYYMRMRDNGAARDELWRSGAYEPSSELPYDYIPYQIDRDRSRPLKQDSNFVVVDVPLWHAHHPPQHFDVDLPSRGLIIPGMNKNDRDAVQRRGKPVLVHVPETGQIFATGIASVHTIKKKDFARYANLITRGCSDYAQAEQELSDKAVTYLGIEDLYPVANTRSVDPNTQSFKLPSVQFYGLVAPQFVALGDKPITAALMPVDYVPQELKPDKTLILREMKAGSFANLRGQQAEDTGHTYETTLRAVVGETGSHAQRGVAISDLVSMARDNSAIQDMVRDAGILGPDHLQKILYDWAKDGLKAEPGQERVVLAKFDPVDRSSWAMRYYTNDGPTAAFRDQGRSVPPSAYRLLQTAAA